MARSLTTPPRARPLELEGTEKVEDHDAYRLKLTMKDGHSIHVWIDAKTFLEAKIEGPPRRLDGLEHPVEIYFRDYRDRRGTEDSFSAGNEGSAAGNSSHRQTSCSCG